MTAALSKNVHASAGYRNLALHAATQTGKPVLRPFCALLARVIEVKALLSEDQSHQLDPLTRSLSHPCQSLTLAKLHILAFTSRAPVAHQRHHAFYVLQNRRLPPHSQVAHLLTRRHVCTSLSPARRNEREADTPPLLSQDGAVQQPNNDGTQADAYGPSHTDSGMSVGHAEVAKKQMSDLVSHLGDRNANTDLKEHFVEQALHGTEKFPHAGHLGCVSVREVTKHYCASLDGNKRLTPCAKKSTDCKHIYGCKACKDGSAQMFPDDVTNCMECVDGYVLEEGGFGDCTGLCRPLDEGEEPPSTTPDTTTTPNTELEDNGEYQIKLVPDKAGHHSPMECKRLNFTDDDVAKWKKQSPLLIMITTLVAKPSVEKEALQNAAAASWDALFPDVITLVAVDTEDQVVPDNMLRILCPSNAAKTPFVANLFGEAERLARETGATFAGYAHPPPSVCKQRCGCEHCSS